MTRDPRVPLSRYATKYATKQERGSKAFEKLVSDALHRTKDLDGEELAQRAFSSFLIQQIGGRNWSAQEVAHVNNGLPTVFHSHDFLEISLSRYARVRTDLAEDDANSKLATEANYFEKYLDRAKSLFGPSLAAGQSTMDDHFPSNEATTEEEEKVCEAPSIPRPTHLGCTCSLRMQPVPIICLALNSGDALLTHRVLPRLRVQDEWARLQGQQSGLTA